MNLVEVLITLCIMSILAAVALPSWHPFFNRENDAVLQNQLLRTIQYARQESEARHVQVGVCKSSNHATCSGDWADGLLVFIDDNDDGVVSDASKILSVVQEDARGGTIYLRSYPSYLSYLQFLPTGLVRSSNNGTFWYCHEAAEQPAWAMTLNQSGETRVLYPDKNGVIKDSQGKPLVC
ncbi:MAG: hypothetical protein EPO11_02955 [Gammaproteobacteria bacterium]|nr:MAG: hypothetical protein EPO11_02955 [Gammaproteobacteria bacterium]